MAMQYPIRTAIPSDAETIIAFNQGIASETENKTLDPDTISAGVIAALADPHKGIYFVATDNEKVIGQLMITLEWSDWRNGLFWWIQSVYVHTDYRKQGVYRGLYEHVQTQAKDQGDVIGIRLYVEHENTRAQQAYRALGMNMTDYHIMEEEF